MKELTPQQKNKILAAAEIVQEGDMAVLKRLLEFQDILENFKEEIDEKLAQKDTKIEEHKENIYSEMSSKTGEMLTEISVIKGEVEKMVKNDHLEAMHTKIMADFDTKLKGFKSDLDLIRASIPEMPESFDPTDILKRINEIESKIPKIPDEITGDRIIEKINDADNKIQRERVEGLDEELKRIESLPRGGGAISAAAAARLFKFIFHTETPSGAINGSNVTYTVQNNIWAIISIEVNGEVMPSTDYSFVNRTITFDTALPSDYSDSDFIVKYIG